MPKNEHQSNLDHIQCQKRSFQEEHDAIRVVNVLDSHHNIEISAESGDSIQNVPRSKTSSSQEPMDCSDMRKICGYDSAAISLSPDGSYWTPSMTLAEGLPADLCAAQIKVLSGSVVMRS